MVVTYGPAQSDSVELDDPPIEGSADAAVPDVAAVVVMIYPYAGKYFSALVSEATFLVVFFRAC